MISQAGFVDMHHTRNFATALGTERLSASWPPPVDDITLHILPYAILSPASVRQAKAVWCSKDRAKAWDDLMFRRIEPRPERDCDTPVEKLVEFGRRIGAGATPTWFLESGERYSGAVPLDEARRLLAEASPVKR